LSVLDFLRVRTWLRMEGPADGAVLSDAAALARLEGLEAHARAAERRHGASSRHDPNETG
jgi:histidinol dehydrogenase